MAGSWALRLQPTEPGWIDLALSAPVMSTARARAEWGWHPARTAPEAVGELLRGLADGAGDDTPPLAPRR
ncbi:MAG: hypothetical protein JO285_02970 [Kutzneria sp.]|nr:hypothetical protein [Kutzneria sp.]